MYFKDRAKNIGAQILIEASDSSNKIAGDGSTAVALLSYHLLDNSVKAVNAGQHPMDVSATLVEDSHTLLEELEKLVIPVKDSQLTQVATVSSGDPLLGQLIAEAILHVGKDGGILTEKAPIPEVEREYLDGYFLQSGFTALQAGKKEIVDPLVIVSSKRITSSVDAIQLLVQTTQAKGLNPQQGQIPRIVFIGNFEDAAYLTIVDSINKGLLDAIIIKTPPMYGELGKYLLEDIAIYAGCEPITESTNLKTFSVMRDGKPYTPFIGSLGKAIANKSESTLFADNKTEAVQTRIAEIKDQIEAEASPSVAEKLRDRVAKLEGKIAMFRIGAPTDTSKEELEFRVEDAINSTRHAHNEGIVAGGGVTLLELSKLDVSEITRKALRATFKQLLINANLPAELKLEEALNAPKGHGFNLRKDDKLVDMVKAGVIDPYVVAREVITHSMNMISETIKTGMQINYEDTIKE